MLVLAPDSTNASPGNNWRLICWTWSSACTRSAAMAKVLLGVTGSVAAMRTPDLYEQLKQAGHSVKVVATEASLYFFDAARLDPVDGTERSRNPEVVILDEDEWP